MTRATKQLSLGAGILLATLWIGACGRSSDEAPPRDAGDGTGAAAETAVPREVLAEAVGDEQTLTVQVVSLTRDTPATITLELVLLNTSTAPGAIDLSQRFASAPPDRGTLADVYVAATGTQHGRKLFVLRDAEDRPDTSNGLTALQSGEETVVRARFPAPPEGVRELEVHVPHAPIMKVPLSGG